MVVAFVVAMVAIVTVAAVVVVVAVSMVVAVAAALVLVASWLAEHWLRAPVKLSAVAMATTAVSRRCGDVGTQTAAYTEVCVLDAVTALFCS